MESRLNYVSVAPDAYKAMSGLETYVKHCGLEKSLLELIKTRSSQINRCAFCLDMHTKYARAAGETEQRLYALSVWRETPFFTDRERAALEWTETVTRIADTHAPDEVYEFVRQHFTEKEMVDLTMAIVTINSWNRLAVSFRSVPSGQTPQKNQP